MFFTNEHSPRIWQKIPNLSFGDRARKIVDNWRSLEPAQQAKYEEMARLDKERYSKELAEWENKAHRLIQPCHYCTLLSGTRITITNRED